MRGAFTNEDLGGGRAGCRAGEPGYIKTESGPGSL